MAKGMLGSWNAKIAMQPSSPKQTATTISRPAFVKILRLLRMS